MKPSAALDALRTFRNSLYECFDRRADALFELAQAILTAGVVPSPVHLSLEHICTVVAGAAFTPRAERREDR